VCSRRERKRPTNATDEEREEEKKVSQKSGNLENEPTQRFFFLHFFPPLSSAWCCPLALKFCAFFLKKARVFFCCFVHHFARYKKHLDALLQLP